jgi:hypothetical protein
MRRVMVRYRVKPDQVETFRLEDGVSFVHIAAVDTADGTNPLGNVEAFARFQEGVAARCDEPPVATGLEQVGAYRFFGDE